MFIRKAIIRNFNDALNLVKYTGASEKILQSLAYKGIHNSIIIHNMDNKALNILKQEALSIGADVAINKTISQFKYGSSNAVLFANNSQMIKLIAKLIPQPFGLHKFALQLNKILNDKIVFQCKRQCFYLDKPILMGVIQIADLKHNNNDLIERAIQFASLGINIIALKTNRKLCNLNHNIMQKLFSILRIIRKNINIPIAIEVYKYTTAKIALDEGADIIYDLFSLSKEKNKLAALIKQQQAGIILTSNSKIKKIQMQENADCIVSELYNFFLCKKNYAITHGITEQQIAIDILVDSVKNFVLLKDLKIFSSIGAVIGSFFNPYVVKRNNLKNNLIASLLIFLYGGNIIKVFNAKNAISILHYINILNQT
ncbi:MAG: dihydropteroate synthase [Endomicrobium sp.]|nr:dihydropteroate synthase [Endomicrobium sp.]